MFVRSRVSIRYGGAGPGTDGASDNNTISLIDQWLPTS